jgi:hypothetical protein
MGEDECGITTENLYPGLFEDYKRERKASEYQMPLNILQIDGTF